VTVLAWFGRQHRRVERVEQTSATKEELKHVKSRVADVRPAQGGCEVSRFARNSRKSQQLVEVCRVVDTVLIDQETVYAPRASNDRLLLGLKGSLNEYELDLLRQRSLGARLAKAKRGELIIIAPVGYCKTEEQRNSVFRWIRIAESRRRSASCSSMFEQEGPGPCVLLRICWVRRRRPRPDGFVRPCVNRSKLVGRDQSLVRRHGWALDTNA
jgi:hypothetical protein